MNRSYSVICECSVVHTDSSLKFQECYVVDMQYYVVDVQYYVVDMQAQQIKHWLLLDHVGGHS